MEERIERLLARLEGEGLDAFLVMQPENRYYLSGFTGSAGALVVGRVGFYFLADFRYAAQASSQCPGFTVIRYKDSLAGALAESLPRWGVSRLGCEGDYLSYRQVELLKEKLEGVELLPLCGVVEELRQVKDAGELEAISQAAALAERAFWHILDYLKPGLTEWEVAVELEAFLRRHGAEKIGFETIVASGPRGALPHGTSTRRVICRGDLVTIDFGCRYRGYHSDLTRTVAVGAPDPRQEEIYRLVLEAQRAAIGAVRGGAKACEVDRAAREVIEAAGYGENFGHSTGHGVGLAVHEEPTVSAKNEKLLLPGMVITIEPGVYIPGWGGVRIEDMVLVEEGGCRVLTGIPKDPMITV